MWVAWGDQEVCRHDDMGVPGFCGLTVRRRAQQVEKVKVFGCARERQEGEAGGKQVD